MYPFQFISLHLNSSDCHVNIISKLSVKECCKGASRLCWFLFSWKVQSLPGPVHNPSGIIQARSFIKSGPDFTPCWFNYYFYTEQNYNYVIGNFPDQILMCTYSCTLIELKETDWGHSFEGSQCKMKLGRVIMLNLSSMKFRIQRQAALFWLSNISLFIKSLGNDCKLMSTLFVSFVDIIWIIGNW